MKKTIKISECYDLFKKYGDLGISVNTPYGYRHINACEITAKDSKYIELETENNKKLVCAPMHKIKISNGKFVNAKDLIVYRSKIKTCDGTSRLKTLKISNNKKDLYDIEVDGVKQYYSNGIVSHNSTILKAISYVLFNKTLETETRMKYGDLRYVNNRNGAKFCSSYIVIEFGGEYFGIKRRTEITTNKNNEINGAPTSLNYYLLSSPDEEMSEKTSLENLQEDKRAITQSKIEKIIGTYDNFMRIVMTTSDTLNRILSNEMAVFVDSLLFDSGLDIFDKKLKALKIYQDKKQQQSRVYCKIEETEALIKLVEDEIKIHENDIELLENTTLPDIVKRINTGQTYVEGLIKKLYKIDDDIYTLDVESLKNDIKSYDASIIEIKERLRILTEAIKPLKKTYDIERLNVLLEKKESHKTNEYALKLKIKEYEQQRRDEEHQIEIINGDIFNLKKSGSAKRDEVERITNSKICVMCTQPLLPEHQSHIDIEIKKIKSEMYQIANQIKEKQEKDIPQHNYLISNIDNEIVKIKEEIVNKTAEMESLLEEIGVLNNAKNDVEKRAIMQNEVDNIPLKIQNKELLLSALQQKIDSHDNSLLQIEANKKVEAGINLAKERLKMLGANKTDIEENIIILKSSVGEKLGKITANNALIKAFKEQEYQDEVVSRYRDCVHRDGIPRQMLSNYIIPKINVTLEKILSIAPFKVWLDVDDLRPKLAYNNRPSAIIDCISSSGKERTFSSVPLKFALNQINIKSKPTIFLLDEVMGKLTNDSVEEFIEILQLIKESMKRVLIIEHNHEVNPDYLINVTQDENGISSLVVE